MEIMLVALDTEVAVASYDIMKQSCGNMCPYIEEIQVKGQMLRQRYGGFPAPLQGER